MPKCAKFVKAGGGRGRPPYGAKCIECGVLYTDHPNPTRDRYHKALKDDGIRGVSAVSTAGPASSVSAPIQGVVPSKV